MAVAGGGGGGRGKVEGRPRLPAALALPPLPPQRTWPIIESMSCPPCGRALAASRSCRVTSLVGRRGGGGAEVGRGERGGASREGGARGARGQALQPSLPTPAHARTQPQRLEASSASIGGVVCAWSGGRARTCATSRRVCTSPLGHNPPATTSFWGGGRAPAPPPAACAHPPWAGARTPQPPNQTLLRRRRTYAGWQSRGGRGGAC